MGPKSNWPKPNPCVFPNDSRKTHFSLWHLKLRNTQILLNQDETAEEETRLQVTSSWEDCLTHYFFLVAVHVRIRRSGISPKPNPRFLPNDSRKTHFSLWHLKLRNTKILLNQDETADEETRSH
jgi:hypothetical protein